jgi:transcription initiation factor IIE alpha subunit
MSLLPEYYCPGCAMQFLALSPKNNEFKCSRCHARWKIYRLKEQKSVNEELKSLAKNVAKNTKQWYP